MSNSFKIKLAYPEGFEPPPAVLETVMLPLTPEIHCLVPPPRIERGIAGYQPTVIPFNYRGIAGAASRIWTYDQRLIKTLLYHWAMEAFKTWRPVPDSNRCPPPWQGGAIGQTMLTSQIWWMRLESNQQCLSGGGFTVHWGYQFSYTSKYGGPWWNRTTCQPPRLIMATGLQPATGNKIHNL